MRDPGRSNRRPGERPKCVGERRLPQLKHRRKQTLPEQLCELSQASYIEQYEQYDHSLLFKQNDAIKETRILECICAHFPCQIHKFYGQYNHLICW